MWRRWGMPGRQRRPPPAADCPRRQTRRPRPERRPGASTWPPPRRRLPGRQAMRRRAARSACPSILRVALHFTHPLNGWVEISLARMAHNVEHFAQHRILKGIENLIASLAVDHDLPAAQDGKLLGEVGLLNPQLGLHGAGGKLSVAENLHD